MDSLLIYALNKALGEYLLYVSPKLEKIEKLLEESTKYFNQLQAKYRDCSMVDLNEEEFLRHVSDNILNVPVVYE